MYSKAHLRVLSNGVDRLMDGDPNDRQCARKVIDELRNLGYVYDHGFIARYSILVNGHMRSDGQWATDLTASEKEFVLTSQGALLPEMEQAIKEERYRDLPDILLQSMASVIMDVRHTKGLRPEPSDLVREDAV